jgi:hypothetical protein
MDLMFSKWNLAIEKDHTYSYTSSFTRQTIHRKTANTYSSILGNHFQSFSTALYVSLQYGISKFLNKDKLMNIYMYCAEIWELH